MQTLSAKTEYACLAVLELSLRHTSGEPVRVRAIANRCGIPSRFLVQILLQLKAAGLVTSTRGSAGGYRLTTSPEAISLWDVISVVEGPAEPNSNAGRATESSAVLLETFRQLAQDQRESLSALTFADLAAQVEEAASDMYYI